MGSWIIHEKVPVAPRMTCGVAVTFVSVTYHKYVIFSKKTII